MEIQKPNVDEEKAIKLTTTEYVPKGNCAGKCSVGLTTRAMIEKLEFYYR